MTRTAISVENLGKEYVIGGQENGGETFREMIVSTATAPFRRMKRLSGNVAAEERIWALKDVSFDVKEGEVVGIIGRNGAGKSTLLKVLSRITAPTEGRVRIRGRVSSLLEVGTGFHPELTGRENIYLNGAILGMSREEIRRKLDDIIEFSGVEKFLDTPVKRYSSGMSVRLAFAVAAHLEPDILIVDEVLAVGDAEFQRKCLGKMNDIAGGGRTVLFVSHNMGALRQLCSRALLLKTGRTMFEGPVDDTITAYLSDFDSKNGSQTEWIWRGDGAPGNADVRLRRVSIVGEASQSLTFRPDESVSITIEYEQLRSIRAMRLSLRIITAFGEVAFATTDENRRDPAGYPHGIYRSVCRLPANLFNATSYTVLLTVISSSSVVVSQLELARIDFVGRASSGVVAERSWPGVLCPKVGWSIEGVSSGQGAPPKEVRSI
jgi:lipopolysaccharide transport system ATP-binding protein